MSPIPIDRTDITRLQKGEQVIVHRTQYCKLTKGVAVLCHCYDETNTIRVFVRRIFFWLIIKPL